MKTFLEKLFIYEQHGIKNMLQYVQKLIKSNTKIKILYFIKFKTKQDKNFRKIFKNFKKFILKF